MATNSDQAAGATKQRKCSRCKGTGTATVKRFASGRLVYCYLQCPKCDGKGTIARVEN